MLVEHNLMRIKQLILIFLLLTLTVTQVYADDYQDGMDAGNRGDYKVALEKLKPLAKQGHAKAQFTLGSMYDTGKGVIQDYKEAFNWYKLSAEKGV